MIATPLTRDQAHAYVREHHRHHRPVTGYRYAFGAMIDGKLCGVAIVGRPCARMLPQYDWAEVTRVATDGTKNACSFLYGVASRMCRTIGFRVLLTYILDSEPGTSLRAAGWVRVYRTDGGSRDRPSRRRQDRSPTCPKQAWAPHWCADVLRAHTEAA